MSTHNNLHAHVSTASADCDGPMYRDYVAEMNSNERDDDQYGDLVFKERMLGNRVSFHTEYEVSVTVKAGGFVTHEQTDEGYRSSDVTWCEDETCDPNAYRQRDVFAERMGY